MLLLYNVLFYEFSYKSTKFCEYIIYNNMFVSCRLDAKTKTILKTWPLTTVRRWAAAPNVFTLDFGDYQDQYYAVQTTEGESLPLVRV